MQDFKSGKYVGGQGGLLLASNVFAPFLNKSITREEFDELVPKAKIEMLSKIRSDTLGVFERILNEEGGSQRPPVIRANLQNLIATYPAVVGTMLAKNPELTEVVCHELQMLEAPKSDLEKEKDWLWLSGGVLLGGVSAFATPIMGIPLTVGRLVQGAAGGLALNGTIQEQMRSQALLDEAITLRSELFSGRGYLSMLVQADEAIDKSNK